MTVYFRVDPTAVCDDNRNTPLKIAVCGFPEVEAQKILEIFAEFTDIADKVKLYQMSVLMFSDKPTRAKEKFQSLLESLPVDLVRISLKTCFHFFASGEQHKYRGGRDTFAVCCQPGENELC